MQKNSIHPDERHRNQHWDGEYFGPDGAIAKAHDDVRHIKWTLVQPAKVGLDKDHQGLMTQVLHAEMRLMSTVFSALGHCASRVKSAVKALDLKSCLVYGTRGVALFHNLLTMVGDIEQRHEELGPGERDVLIATLTVTRRLSLVYMDLWHGKRAAELIRYQIRSLPSDYASLLFAKARALSLKKYFNESERDDFLEHVQHALKDNSPEGIFPTLSWSDVARLARLVGDTERQKYAAAKDGSVDARLKAGLPATN